MCFIFSHRVPLQQRKGLGRVYKELFSILEVGMKIELKSVVSPVVICYYDLILFCSITAIEDMPGDMELGKGQFELEANQLFSHFKIVLKKFSLECANYIFRHEMIGHSPRTEVHVRQWYISNVIICITFAKVNTISPNRFHSAYSQVIGEKLRASNAQFPNTRATRRLG
ncbi:hypothetical protein PHMEG_0001057 [Phytophthora megakarya]|uniref:Uncharacterized protein n=1 Tax=Phytophthora megakarya TaxID=4795 RepID=A0A225X2S0_9STRA|nr:hypothetical protein PHMEG_0001057 [Phytophthora megakarya]